MANAVVLLRNEKRGVIMKNGKLRRLGCLFTLLLALTCLLSVSAFAGEVERYGYSTLEHVLDLFDVPDEQWDAELDKLQTIYKDLEQAIVEKTERVEMDLDWMQNEYYLKLVSDKEQHVLLNYLIRLLVDDHPECYWFDGTYMIGVTSQGEQVIGKSVRPVYTHTDAADAKAFTDGVADLLGDVAENDSTYVKAWKIHKALAAHVDYNTDYGNEQSAFSAIAEGQAVCAGYARAYQYLLNQVGIRAWTVEGESYQPGTANQIPHAWNLVWLDDNCFYTDVTWDDQGDGQLYHAYFNNTLNEIKRDHVIYEFVDLPTCNHDPEKVTAVNYFVQHGGVNGAIYLTEDTTVQEFKKVAVPVNNMYFFDILCKTDLEEWLESDWSDEYSERYGDGGNKFTELLLELGFDLEKSVSNGGQGLGSELKFYLFYEDGSELPEAPVDPEEPENPGGGGNEPDGPGEGGGDEPDGPGEGGGDDPIEPGDPYKDMGEFDGRVAAIEDKQITAYVVYGDELEDAVQYDFWVAYYKDGAFAGIDMIKVTLENGRAKLTADCPETFDNCVVFAVTANDNPAPLCASLQLSLPVLAQ